MVCGVQAEHACHAAGDVVGRLPLEASKAFAALDEVFTGGSLPSANDGDLARNDSLPSRVRELARDREIGRESPQCPVREAGVELGAHDVELGLRQPPATLARASVRLLNLDLLDESRRVLDEHRRTESVRRASEDTPR